MDIRYEEWPPCAELAGVVTAVWEVVGDASKIPFPAILPDANVELVLNLGAPVGLAGPAYTGEMPERAVTGLISRAVRMDYRGPSHMLGIRFHPARGAGFFGHRAAVLTE